MIRSRTIALAAIVGCGVALGGVDVGVTGAASSGATGRAAACPGDHATLTLSNLTAVRTAVVCLMNVERKRFGLPALTANAELNVAAQGHVADMLAHDYFSHNSKSGSTPASRITQAGYHWASYGENIAAGYPSALSVVTAWMSDVSHCSNILYPGFADVGVGGVGKALPRFASGPSVWTADFGLGLGVKPPSQNAQPSKTCPHGL